MRCLILLSVLLLGFATEEASGQALLRGEDEGSSGQQVKAAQEEQQAPPGKWSLTPSGEIVNYLLYQSHAFFGKRTKAWMETSAHLEGTLRYQDLTIDLRGSPETGLGKKPDLVDS
jgi:hypothetical protein